MDKMKLLLIKKNIIQPEKSKNLPILKAKPIDLPILKAKPIDLPILKAKPRSLPILKAKPRSLPILKAKPRTLPILKAKPRSLPILKAKPINFPILKAKPINLPILKAKPINFPILKAKPINFPILKAKPINLPILKAKPKSLPIQKAKPNIHNIKSNNGFIQDQKILLLGKNNQTKKKIILIPTNSKLSITNEDIYKYFNSNNGFGQNKKIAISLLDKTIKILKEFDINYFLISGTLLGLVRHNDFIQWDDDIDIIVDYNIMNKLDSIKNKYKNFYFRVYKDKCFIKISFAKTNYPFVDMFTFEYDEQKEHMFFFNKKWESKYFFPPQEKLFLNMNVLIPNDPYYFLDRNFKGDYMNILISSQYNHKTEKIIYEKRIINIEQYNNVFIDKSKTTINLSKENNVIIDSYYNINSLIFLDISNNNYCNASICANRLFYKKLESNIYSIEYCLVINILNSKTIINYEDPRVIEHNGYLFLTYTDGQNIGIAKLDYDANIIYSHFLEKPEQVSNNYTDGREKNWIPFSFEETICFLYSDTPRQIIRYKDIGKSLELVAIDNPLKSIKCNYGIVRGGCPPISYDETKFVWFFHTVYNSKYTIGAYLTEGFFNPISISDKPLLIGDTNEKLKLTNDGKDNVIFPCSAIKTMFGWRISLGVNDCKIAFLDIDKISLDKTFMELHLQ